MEPAQAEAITRIMSEMMDQLSTAMGELYVCKMELEKVPPTRTGTGTGLAAVAWLSTHIPPRTFDPAL